MKIPSVKGFHDVLPGESGRWAHIEMRARDVFRRFGFEEIRLPIVERAELFRRSVGEATDIVEKEMYVFSDRDGSEVTLRPEGTASAVRAYVQHSLQVREAVSKLFYLGPMFRRERPQRGRLRQFSQIGAELFGRDDAAADAEILILLATLLEELGVRSSRFGVNTLGDGTCRPAFREAVVAWGEEHRDALCADCVRRLRHNPLRVLDCKVPQCVTLRASAPAMIDLCCDPCRAHFERVLELVGAQGCTVHLERHMMRGLDYYCRTAFEVTAEGLGAQNAIGGGGRYDGLVKQMGGPQVGGIGFALGIERLVMVLQEQGVEAERRRPELFVVPLGEACEAAAFTMAGRWRTEGAAVELEAGAKSLKSQMRRADKLGCRFVVIVGEDEIAAGRITVRDMQSRSDHPQVASLECSVDELRSVVTSSAGAEERV